MSKRIISIILALTILTPILVNLAFIAPVTSAQGIIVSVTGADSQGVYPGGTINVTVTVPLTAAVTIEVSNAFTGQVYATQTFYPPSPGTYSILVPIPKNLPNIGTNDPPALLVTASIPFIGQDQRTLYVYPLIEVTPSVTTIVDGKRNFNSIVVNGYGFPEGASITAVNFDGATYSTTYTVSATAGADGSVSIPIQFSYDESLIFVLPADKYNVNFTSTATLMYRAKVGVLTVIPQVVVSPSEGNGKADEAISLEGFGFPAGASISIIELYNTNFTKVVYVFNVAGSVAADSVGHFNISNLKDYNGTNMAAGLYIPRVTLSDGTKYEFRNTYHLVRPILCYVDNSGPQCGGPAPSVLPGQVITIVAYGYGPGAAWGYNENYLDVSYDKIMPLDTIPKPVVLDKDGNATFQVTIPLNTSFGAHYIWGIDSWDYEYSLAVIVGTTAYWVGLNPLTNEPMKNTTKVSAGLYDGEKYYVLKICPCETAVGTAYCGECVVYGGECDYLGNIIQVVAYGLASGEQVTVYFGSIQVASGAADDNGFFSAKFVVPTLPEGEYTIRIIGSVTGEHIVDFSMNVNNYANPYVAPKIVLASLSGDYIPILVGSGIVRVLGTGFTPGVAFAGVLINDTDALMSVTTNVLRWTSDSNGVLVSQFTGTLGLWIPMVQPGKYAVSLVYSVNNTFMKSMPGFVYVVNNISRAATIDNVKEVGSKVDQVAGTLNGLVNTVSSVSAVVNNIKSAVDTVNSKLDALSSTVASKTDVNNVASKVDALSTSVSSVVSKLDSVTSQLNSAVQSLNTISSDISGLKTGVNDVKTAVSGVASKVDNVASTLSTVSSDVSGLKTSVGSLQNTLNTVSGKVDTAISKADAAGASATNAFYIGLVAVIFALLATVFALLAYLTVRRSIVSK
ncbi:hypothetical protein [Desulfurococcus mucosus]|uniref:Uncharacterized protein n=1 Tax=Desulfurococcus mucosus (strain ATCC 35584 / DSM 2162 / JCM 9187 / O7/1) TaxID=765177 RepID=E8R795_DESM0|nr:hypothetical protein [Desulfurococcus mucosus]ADV65560.1 hypothetical protein Desmu_1264 [Desulfurococcus mucosus DSM 2162]